MRTAKHMEIRLWFARDQYRMSKYAFEQVSSEKMIADINTKAQYAELFYAQRVELMGLALSPELLMMFKGSPTI